MTTETRLTALIRSLLHHITKLAANEYENNCLFSIDLLCLYSDTRQFIIFIILVAISYKNFIVDFGIIIQ